ERHLHVAKQRCQMQRVELWLEALTQLPGGIGVLTGEVARTLDRYLIEGDELLALTAEVFDAGHLVVEELEREQVEPVRPTAWIQHVAGNHRVEVDASQRDTRDAKRQQIELRVLRRLLDARVFQERLEWRGLRAIDRRQVLHLVRSTSQSACRDAR